MTKMSNHDYFRITPVSVFNRYGKKVHDRLDIYDNDVTDKIDTVYASEYDLDLYIPSLITNQWREDEVWQTHLCSEISAAPSRSHVRVAKFGFEDVVTKEVFGWYTIRLVNRLRDSSYYNAVTIICELASVAVAVLWVDVADCGGGNSGIFIVLGRVWKKVDGGGGYINMCMIGDPSAVNVFYNDVVSGNDLLGKDMSYKDFRAYYVMAAINGYEHFEDAITDP